MIILLPSTLNAGVQLDKTNVTMKVGENFRLNASFQYANEFMFEISSSSGENVIRLLRSLRYCDVYAISQGTATIKCTEMNLMTYTATCKITVSGYLAGYKFTEKTAEGVDMWFVVNEDENSCSVRYDAINKSTTGTVTIPEYAKGLKVTGINVNAFEDCINLTDVIIPQSVEIIRDGAFSGCTSLTSITFPSTLTSIGEQCFMGCKALESISGFNNVEYVGKNAFYDTSWYNNLLDGVVYIGKVFYKYKGSIPKESTLEIAEGIVMITEGAISHYGATCDLIIPKSVTTIGYSKYGCLNARIRSISVDPKNPVYDSRDGCHAIIEKNTNTILEASNSTTEIPQSVKTIWNKAFSDYRGQSITIPDNVEKICNGAFYDSYLHTIKIGSGVKDMDDNPFQDSRYLDTILVSPYNNYYDSRNNCNAIIEKSSNKLITGCNKTVIPESVKTIGKYAFSTSYDEKINIVIPDNVEKIEDYAFYDVYRLESITFGKNIQELGYQIIYYRNGLKYIRMLSSLPCSISSGTFSNDVYEKVPLYVPKGALSSYIIADNWSKFKTIKEGEPPILVTAIALNSNELTLTAGDTSQLTAVLTPEEATDKTVTWSSDNEDVATVNSTGLVTAKLAGNATITCKAVDEGGVKATCKITVNALPPTAVSIPKSATVVKDSRITLTPTFSPEFATATLTWSSDDESVATVNNEGVVTGIRKGQTFINVETDNGKTASCKLTVTAPEPIEVELPISLTVNVGENYTLIPHLTPEDAETTYTWTSDDESVATVNNEGVITGMTKGQTIISVETSNGKKASCKLTVKEILVTSINLNNEALTLSIGETSQLTAEVTPEDATEKTVTWSSNNENVATVSSTGLVTANSAGNAIITCEAADESGVTSTCQITVKTPSPTKIYIPESASVEVGATITLTPTFEPANASASLTWSSDDETIATVNSEGVVTGVKKGNTFITVETDNGKYADCKVTVIALEPTDIELPRNVSLYIGGTLKLTPTITPERAETTLTWKSDDETVVTVGDDGMLTGIGEGVARVSVSTANGLTSNTCKVKVELDPDGIASVPTDGTKDTIFNLSGQRVAAPRKGIYIRGGKKVIVK